MEEITAKERIFKKIRDALYVAPSEPAPKVDLDSPVFSTPAENPDVVFAESFVANGGSFVYCESVDETLETVFSMVRENGWDGHIFCRDEVVEEILKTCRIGYGREVLDAVLKPVVFAGCRYLVEQEGSVLFDSSQTGRKAFAQAETVVFVASAGQLVPDLRTAFHLLKSDVSEQASVISLWTGLSRFTDIDGNRMEGLGPKKVYVVLIDNADNG